MSISPSPVSALMSFLKAKFPEGATPATASFDDLASICRQATEQGLPACRTIGWLRNKGVSADSLEELAALPEMVKSQKFDEAAPNTGDSIAQIHEEQHQSNYETFQDIVRG